jgi:hypothetical protein
MMKEPAPSTRNAGIPARGLEACTERREGYRHSRCGRRALKAKSTGAVAALLCCLLSLTSFRAAGAEPTPSTSPALAPAKVVTVYDPEATDAFRPRPDKIRQMVERALTNLTAKPTLREAWRSLVSTQDVVGIKIYSLPGPNSGTRPPVVAAVVEGILAAGVPPKNVILWDRHLTDLRLAGYYDLAERYGIRIAASTDTGFDPNVYYDTPLIGNLVWGDVEFGKKGDGIGRKSFVTKLLTQQTTKTINITPLLNHNLAGVSGTLYSLALGSVDNIVRFESEPERLATAVPEIYALKELGDHVVLNIVDALVCQYEGGERGLLHYSATLNELRFSRDPVALDALSLQELDRQRRAAGAPAIKPNLELYSNAALLELGVNDLKRIRVEQLK